MNIVTKKELLATLRLLRVHQCAYMGPGGLEAQICDCKFRKKGDPVTWGSERGNACPELYQAITVIERMSDSNFTKLLKRS